MKFCTGSLVALALHASVVVAENLNFKVGDPIWTSSGRIRGHAAPNETTVSEYLGIPFAKPPVGDLRFAPPQAYTSTRDINASSYPLSCPQSNQQVPTALPQTLYNLLVGIAGADTNKSEDCLYANVWTKPQSGSSKKPVLVWIYGGGYNTGGSGTPGYSGQYFAADEDVVFVSFNYRLNIFGFPGADYLTQNLGFLDQRLALEWVRLNVAAFGGDPSRITIFGQSAGAGSVDIYNFAWKNDPIIAGSIMESGTAISFGNRQPATAAASWNSATTKLGCGNSTSRTPQQVLACMRQPNITFQAIESAIAVSGLAGVLGAFGPTIDNKTVFSNYTDLTVKGQFARKPVLLGSNVYEGGLFALIAAGEGIAASQDSEYAFTSQVFTCPASRVAALRSTQVPTWRYFYYPNFPNINLPVTNLTQAYHTAELLPLFGTDQDVTKADSTWQERQTGRYLRAAWAAFARNPANGLHLEFNWPNYSNATDSLILLGYENRTNSAIEVSPSVADQGKCGGVVGVPSS